MHILNSKDILEDMRSMLRKDYGIISEPISEQDIQCLWIRIPLINGYHPITQEFIDDLSFHPEYISDIREKQKDL